ncbi:hypothetical protein L3V18_09015 [Lysobacter sp. TLK-CK17T]|uniref:Biotin transporter n=2 Tax=Marilutibacter chinensis TaxID=2912247 RepID=A0ABS9HU75_9GAMM|nr:hypothetical protein [Lysobacter chinensis]
MKPVATRSPSTSTRSSAGTFAAGPLVLAGLILIAALTRLLPHPPNFSPVAAIALFGGAYFMSRQWAFIVPLAAMLISDIALAAINGGIYASWFGGFAIWLGYGCVALTTALGFGLRGRVGGGRVLGFGLLASVLFFVISNFGAWLTLPEYPKTFGGLGMAYTAAIPFFQWTVLGTLFYAALLFGGFALLRSRVPALRAQTA